MNHETFSLLAMSVLTLMSLSCSSSDTSKKDLIAKAKAIHNRVLTIDTHDDIPFNFATDEVDPGVRGDRQLDIPKMQEGGLDAGFFIVYVSQTERTPENYEKTMADALTKFNAIHRMCEDMYPEKIELAYTPDEVERIHKNGKLVACIGIENGYVIGKDLSLLKKYHELGARYITLAHNGHNDICDSANPRESLGDQETEHNGVSKFGEKVIAEMNRLGIMVDISHISKKSMLDAVKLSKAPVIASHSSVRALCDVSRNLDDEQLLALKENGGVMQTVALSAFVKEMPPEKRAAIDSLREAMGLTDFSVWRTLSDKQKDEYRRQRRELDKRWPPATVQDFVDHIDYAVDLIGIDHVGISSDFDGGGGVEGWMDASETFNVTSELVHRGYSEEEIAKLWGGNLLRVWRQVERVASELQPVSANQSATGSS
ncbi:membrane dipeptidase [candidate division KSB1 bacterium]|nr:membrane dipeptidase [candidate division KSB1 bacterium]NIR69641.1 membrane dipeptidase [candidate division KSB1 bacterium]NIS22870.1 membrane dipeptidase [candidate division KSB1 bacterium]NIT69708.1 membrane dipeptidase [candidate division KSB1 bacterium]NIU23376.1 membrane dipeptidase [candidate division KSB1 bacterium]